MEETLLMFPPEELPQTDEPKKKEKVNCLQDILLELMDERNINPAEIVRATQIPWGTFHGWMCGDVICQKADKNLLKLAQFFNVRLEYLIYGIGDDSAAFEEFAQ